MKKTNAVVTGCTGAIGTALLRLLVCEGYTVYAVVRKNSPRIVNLPISPQIHVIHCDLADMVQLPSKIPPSELFFHLGWEGTFGDSRNDMKRQTGNILSAVRAAEAAYALGCRVFVGAGSQAEYGRKDTALTPQLSCFPESGYGMAKLCAGQMTRTVCERAGILHVWMRILSVYGEHDGENTLVMSAVRKLLHGERFSCTAGEQIWDYLYSGDAARALLLAAQNCRKSAIYCLGSGQPQKLRSYIETIRDIVSPSAVIGFGDIPYSDRQVMCLYADISALTRDTGFTPVVSFAEGVQHLLEGRLFVGDRISTPPNPTFVSSSKMPTLKTTIKKHRKDST